MNANELYMALNNLDDDLILRSEVATSNRTSFGIKRRLSIGLIASILMLLMMGAGIATMIYSDNIQHWFGYYWELITGQQMSVEHIALIDHLSQHIGISQTIGDITVTVDSATVGDDSFFLLVKTSGIKLSDRYGYSFDKMYIDISPDPWGDNVGMGSFGADFHGIDHNGEGLFLFSHEYTTNGEIITDPLDITLSLGNISMFKSGNNAVVAEGPWEFSFTINPNILDDVITLPDIEVMAFDHTADEYTEIPVTISNIEINCTSLRFSYNHHGGTLTVDSHIYAILNDGQEIGISGGSGTVDGDILNNVYRWIIPIEPDELSAIKFGNTVLSVP